MDPVFRVMCVVAGLVTRGSDAARMEMQRMAAERERRTAAHVTAFVEQAIIASPASKRNPVPFYEWLKLAFRSL